MCGLRALCIALTLTLLPNGALGLTGIVTKVNYMINTTYAFNYCILYRKRQEYDIEPCNTYNTDEKCFFVGITTRSKRVVSMAI
jgi:hypothetical protein